MTDTVGDEIRKILAEDGFAQAVIDSVMEQERQPELSRGYRIGLALAAAKRLSAVKEPA